MSGLIPTNRRKETYMHWQTFMQGGCCVWVRGLEIINSHKVQWKLSSDLVSPGLLLFSFPILPTLCPWKSLRRSFVTLEGYLLLLDFFSLSLSQCFAPVLNFLSETNFLWNLKTLCSHFLLMFSMQDIQSCMHLTR